MIQLVLLACGLLAIVAGVAALSIPAALIVAGVALSVFALTWDFNPRKGGARGSAD